MLHSFFFLFRLRSLFSFLFFIQYRRVFVVEGNVRDVWVECDAGERVKAECHGMRGNEL